MNKLEYQVDIPETRKKEIIAALEQKLNSRYGSTITVSYLFEIAEDNNDDEIYFMEQWLEDKDVVILGLNGPVSNKMTNYREVIEKMNDGITPVSHEEQVEYFKKIEKGDKKARKEFAERNMALSLWVVDTLKANKLKYVRMPKEDQLAYGFEGLLKAIDHFSVDKGCMFSTYAVPTIYNHLLRCIAEERRSYYSTSYGVLEMMDTISNIENEFKNQGETASVQDIANILGIAEDRARDYQKIMNRIGYGEKIESIENLKDTEYDSIVDNAHDSDYIVETESGYVLDGVYVDSDKNNTVQEVISSDFENEDNQSVEELSETNSLKASLNQVLETLTDREEEVLRMRFGLDGDSSKNLEEVGARFSVTRERIRQIEAKALRKLRHPSRSRKIEDYLYGDNYTPSRGKYTSNKVVYSLIASGWLEVQNILKYPGTAKRIAQKMLEEKEKENNDSIEKNIVNEKNNDEKVEEKVEENVANTVVDSINAENTVDNLNVEDDLSNEFEEFFDEIDDIQSDVDEELDFEEVETTEIQNNEEDLEKETDSNQELDILNEAVKHAEERLNKKNQEIELKKQKLEKLREAEDAIKRLQRVEAQLESANEEERELDEKIAEMERITKKFFGTLELDDEDIKELGGQENE